MSKPLVTKVSTPLSENVQIGPKVSIFCVATIIFQHCLNPLGHGVHQSFTGCHWSPLPLFHSWWILETLRSSTFRLRMPHRCSIRFRSETCLASPSPLPSASLARQWSLWILPCSPVSEGRGSCSASVCHSTSWHSWFPQLNVAPKCRQHSCSPRHSHHHAWPTVTRHTCLCTHHLVAATHAWHHLNQLSLSWSHQTTGHGSSNPFP